MASTTIEDEEVKASCFAALAGCRRGMILMNPRRRPDGRAMFLRFCRQIGELDPTFLGRS